MKNLIKIAPAIVLFSALQAQDLPDFMDINKEQTMLTTGDQEIKGFYNESKLRSLYLEFEDSNYWTLLEDYYDTENYVQATLIYKDDTLYDVGVQFKGNTSYTRLEEGDEKMSFSIKTDQFIDGQDVDGYSNLNLNNAHEDMSTMKEVLYAHLCRKHIPAPQANFIQLFINGEYWGPYTNVQQVNRDMIAEWFMSNDGANFRADSESSTTGPGGGGPGGGGMGGDPGGGGMGAQWGDGTAALNYHDDDTTTYQEYYTLKASEIEDPWEKLITVCDVLNNTDLDQLEDALSEVMDIDRTLWFLAHEIIYSDDDSYVYKGKMDYYIYYEVETGRMVPLEFDGNSALALNNVDWDIFMNADNENYPLLNRLLAIPSLRQRYLAHVRTILEEEMIVDEVHTLIDTYAALLDSSIQADPKKLMTYNEYLDGIDDLKTYFTNRYANLTSDSEVDVTGLGISTVEFKGSDNEGSLPYATESVTIEVELEADQASQVLLHYASGFVGNFETIDMTASGGGFYAANIPGHSAGDYVRYYVEVIANDDAMTRTFSPSGSEHNTYLYKVKYDETATSDIVINELMAANDATIADQAGEYDDWIELYNTTDQEISLAGLYLTDNVDNLDKHALPDTVLPAGGYLLIWADEDGSQGDDHVNFKLDSDGEDLFLVDSTGNILDQVSFSALDADVAYARSPNGSGNFATMEATPLAINDGEIIVASVEDEIPSVEFRAFPNPSVGHLFIQAPTSVDTPIRIFNLQGKQVFKGAFFNGMKHVYTDGWTPGMYLVVVGNQAERIVVK